MSVGVITRGEIRDLLPAKDVPPGRREPRAGVQFLLLGHAPAATEDRDAGAVLGWFREPAGSRHRDPSLATSMTEVGRTGDAERGTPLTVRALDVSTWPAFARLVEANDGVWGGCWCMGFHVRLGQGRTPAQNRADKEARVRDGRAHAALVLDGQDCVGWCQFGPPDELPQIKSRRRYDAGLTHPPDWRVTCFFTGKGHRGRGVADLALGGALDLVARAGGGLVEGYPEETDDRTVPGAYLHTGPMAAFEHHGFTRIRSISPHRWVVTRTVDGAPRRDSER